MELERSKKDRTMLMVRIVITLLILAMLLPGWGLLSSSTLAKHQSTIATDAIGTMSPRDR